jgi:hypothetical protein
MHTTITMAAIVALLFVGENLEVLTSPQVQIILGILSVGGFEVARRMDPKGKSNA